MTTYYVSPDGSDSNNGLGPDASHASNKPWLTIGKALGASGIASGDTVYLAPGTYREVISVAMTSATVETQVLGDPANAQGFRTSGGVLRSAGYVVWTAYTTNDTTAPTTSALLNLNARDFLTFQDILMVGASLQDGSVVLAGALSTDIVFRRCVMIGSRITGSQTLVNVTGTGGSALNWTIDRCILDVSCQFAIQFTLPTVASTDYDVNVLIRNTRIVSLGNGGVRVNTSGALSNKAGGVDILNCDLFTSDQAFQTNSANLSTSIPCTINNSRIVCAGAGINANASGQITENYNWICAVTPRTNVSTGANSIAVASSTIAYAPLIEVGQAELWGFATRPYGMPMVGSPLLNFNGTGAPSVDMLNRPRPAGSGLAASAGVNVAVGALERHDTAAQETSTVDAGSSGIVIVGPGDHDLKVPVDASSTTLSIKARYDSTHAATNKPQAILLANPKLGVTAETKTMTSAADTWETLTFASQTPSAKGVLTIRLVSRSAAGGGKAFFDTVT